MATLNNRAMKPSNETVTSDPKMPNMSPTSPGAVESRGNSAGSMRSPSSGNKTYAGMGSGRLPDGGPSTP